MKKILFTAALLVLATGSVMAQTTLTNDWKKTGGVDFAFFNGSDNLTRGFDVNVSTNKIYVVSRTGGNFVRIISTAGVDAAATLPATYGAGTFAINKVAVAADNVIYTTNLAAATSTFIIYRNADDVTAATTSFTQAAVTERLGDDIDIKGSGNSTQLLVAGSNATSVSIFSTADGGLTFTRAIVTPSNPAITGTPHAVWDTTSGFWFRNAGGVGGKYDNAGVGAGQSAPQGASTLYGAIDVAATFGATAAPVYALSSGNVGAGNTIIQGAIYAQSDLTTAVYVSDSIRPTAGTVANGNASGDVFLDAANNRVYWLVTNNVIARDSVGAAVASDWNTYF